MIFNMFRKNKKEMNKRNYHLFNKKFSKITIYGNIVCKKCIGSIYEDSTCILITIIN